MLLLAAVRCYVLLRSFPCVVDGMRRVAMRQKCLMRAGQHISRLEKLRGFAVVPCCVLMMFSGKFLEFGQR